MYRWCRRLELGPRAALGWCVAALVGWLTALPAAAYTPESPEVRQMLDKAVGYLEQAPPHSFGHGGDFLMAMALMKAGQDEGHPLVRSAVEKALKMVAQVREQGIGSSVYNEAICSYFLCDLNPTRYRNEIATMVAAMVQRQRPNGCWGYKPHSYDDTSQTQYGVLALWAAHQHGFDVPGEAIERALNWLMRVQDVEGGWSYDPRDPQKLERQKRQNVTLSMAAAGLSSVYICAHLLGFSADAGQAQAEEEAEDRLPPAVQRVGAEQNRRKKVRPFRPTMTNAQALRTTQDLGNAWFAKNQTYETDLWTHYYMYAVERYKSFQELTEGQAVPEPDWYNQGVVQLRKTQLENGSWFTLRSHGSGPQVDTAFAMLFLTRSSQKAIRRAVLDEGIAIGGKGLPKNMANAKLIDGQVVTPQMIQDVDDLLVLLSKAEDKDFDATRLPGGLSLDQDLTKRTSQLERLRELVTAEDFQTRLAAVKTLAAARDLDNVPALIYALGDPDPRIMREARDGLRLISRKFQGFELSGEPTPQELDAARNRWKQWYLSIRPDGEFID